MDLVNEARTLSSGTLATLTGERRYAALEVIQQEFVEFCEENANRYEHWQAAWKDYRLAKTHS
jgi:hypothetical protein